MHIILKEIEFLEPISFLVRSHHKQVNGRGYSDGLKGEEMLLLLMIISAGSIYDSLAKKWKVPMEDSPDRLQRSRWDFLRRHY